jgi:hypothetical protein
MTNDVTIEELLGTKPKTPPCHLSRRQGNCLVWTRDSGEWKEYKGIKNKDRRTEVIKRNGEKSKPTVQVSCP